MVLGKGVHAKGDWLDFVFLAKLQHSLDLLGRARRVGVLVVELDPPEPEILNLLERLFQCELAIGVALHAYLEAADIGALLFRTLPQPTDQQRQHSPLRPHLFEPAHK